MVGVEKAAILLATLGPEAAAGVFRHLSEPEVRQLSAAIARLRSIPREQAAAVHEEAWRRLTEREGLLVDGERFARQMIAAALTGAREERPADKAAQPGGEFLAASLDPVAPAALAQVLGREHPQVIALVLANLRAQGRRGAGRAPRGPPARDRAAHRRSAERPRKSPRRRGRRARRAGAGPRAGRAARRLPRRQADRGHPERRRRGGRGARLRAPRSARARGEIGRASCRE